jgi:ketosteroid isomerase-like protein
MEHGAGSVEKAIPRCFLLFVLAALVFSCSHRNFDLAAEEAKLSRQDAEWADLATAGKDIDKIVSYWSDDAILIFPGQPVLDGKQAIRAYVEASLKTPGFKIHWVSEKPVFSPDGKLAYMRGTDELTVPGPNGVPTTLHLRGISVWRMDPDGQWRCVVDISNEEPPPASTVK